MLSLSFICKLAGVFALYNKQPTGVRLSWLKMLMI